jgi:hypothetical protein
MGKGFFVLWFARDKQKAFVYAVSVTLLTIARLDAAVQLKHDVCG